MTYCKHCKQHVAEVKKFSILIFLFGLFMFGVGALVYLIYYFFIKKGKCPVCGAKL